MVRPKEFNEAEVLCRAMELFWVQGYARTSFSDLTSTLGVSRQSLYETYGNKHTFYLRALNHYLAEALENNRKLLQVPGAMRDVMRAYLRELTQASCGRGCFAVNMMMEQAPTDPGVASAIHAHIEEVKEMLAERFREAQARGEVGADRNPRELAAFFHGMAISLSVTARAFGFEESLELSIEAALRTLD